tara:strand:+ start:1042 stop:1269 length:228 start_codon:yes stop_codon:yes gene_type:complete
MAGPKDKRKRKDYVKTSDKRKIMTVPASALFDDDNPGGIETKGNKSDQMTQEEWEAFMKKNFSKAQQLKNNKFMV